MDGQSIAALVIICGVLYYYHVYKKEKEGRHRQLLHRVNHDLTDIDGWNHKPTAFEDYLKDCFTVMGYDCTLTKKSGDMGGDIIAQKGKQRICIQVKCHGPGHSVGSGAVMEAYTGAAYYNCEYSMVITNRHFTRAATKLASQIGVRLWDRDALSFNLIYQMHKILDFELNGKTFGEKYLPSFLRKTGRI